METSTWATVVSVGMPPSISAAWCRRLNHDVLTLPAGVFGSPDHQNPELGGDDVETLSAIFADDVQQPTAARAVLIFNIDYHLDTRQVARQRASVRAALRGLRLSLGRGLGLIVSFLAGCRLFDLFEAQQQLILWKRLGPAAELMTLQLLDDLGEPLGAGTLREQHRFQCAGIIGERICRSPT